MLKSTEVGHQYILRKIFLTKPQRSATIGGSISVQMDPLLKKYFVLEKRRVDFVTHLVASLTGLIEQV